MLPILPDMDLAQPACFNDMREAGLPLTQMYGDTFIYSRRLTTEEETLAQRYIDHYKNGGYDYLNNRKYPNIEDQLDMIYWDNVNNTTEWVDRITAIKDADPKPPLPELNG
jgi:N-acetylmuramoyl-L-alanine amidase CwlA